jgi:hypothetical protein
VDGILVMCIRFAACIDYTNCTKAYYYKISILLYILSPPKSLKCYICSFHGGENTLISMLLYISNPSHLRFISTAHDEADYRKFELEIVT